MGYVILDPEAWEVLYMIMGGGSYVTPMVVGVYRDWSGCSASNLYI